MRRINLTFGILIGVLLSSLVVAHYYQPSEESIVAGVTSRTHELLKIQQADIEDFENQLSVYTNPFGISEEGFFEKRVYLNGGLIYWNTTDYLPEYTALKKQESLYTIKDATGVKIIRRHEIVANKDLIEIFSVIHVLDVPPVNNQYLQSSLNSLIFVNQQVSIDEQGEHVIESNGKELFRFNIGDQDQRVNEWIEFVVLLLIILCSLFWVLKTNGQTSWLWAVTVLVLGRLVLFGWSLMSVSSIDIFNPIYFTSGSLNHSLGDLALNAVIILAILSLGYAWFVSKYVRKGKQLSGSDDLTTIILSLFGLVAFTYLFYESVWLVC